jgi:hypothetical protein
MAKQYHIHLRGKQREQIDSDLVAQLVVMLGTQLADEARLRDVPTRQTETAQEARTLVGEHERGAS